MKEALKLALEALDNLMYWDNGKPDYDEAREAITAIKEALAQPEQERNALPKAMNVVIAAMQADPGYAWSWHCNVAMAYVDEGVNHGVANQGAARFMKLLANVEPAHDILPTQTPDAKLKEPEQEPVAKNEEGRITWLVDNWPQNCLLYTTPPQRKPLTHEQRFDLLTKFEPHKNKWEAPAILIDMVEAAHGIKE